jgi:methionine synthase II (cobalamin-independent)
MADFVPEKVHLVGSIGLDSVEEIFRTVGRMFGRRLRRVPDGEVGPRRLWVTFQYPLLRSSPFLQRDPGGALRKTSGIPLVCLADGVDPADIRFGELGYVREARGSYADFCAARERGELPRDVRFQVCLPTPMSVAYAFCIPRDVVAVNAAYERAMIDEVKLLCRAIPHRDLAIQWDFCHEMILWDGQPQDHFAPATKEEIIRSVRDVCAPVPDDVEMGFHLCYGDFGAKHYFDPVDAGKMVEVCNALAQNVRHRLAYIHLPVPIDRSDDDYFKALKDLKIDPATEIYLGLVHAVDGPEGTRKRIATASRHVKDFGIATECGMARARTPEVVKQMLAVHAAVSREPRA